MFTKRRITVVDVRDAWAALLAEAKRAGRTDTDNWQLLEKGPSHTQLPNFYAAQIPGPNGGDLVLGETAKQTYIYLGAMTDAIRLVRKDG